MKDDHVLGVVLERVSEYVPLSSIMIVGATSVSYTHLTLPTKA